MSNILESIVCVLTSHYENLSRTLAFSFLGNGTQADYQLPTNSFDGVAHLAGYAGAATKFYYQQYFPWRIG